MWKFRQLTLWFCAAWIGFNPAILPAQESDAEDQSRTIIVNHPRKLERPPQIFRAAVRPAREPSPPLKYRLYPTRVELQPGNSVPFYYRAILGSAALPPQTKTDFYELMEELGEKPLADYPGLKAGEKFDQFPFKSLLGELEVAVLRETTDWDWQLNQVTGFDTIAFRLEEIQESRNLARILTVRARIAASEGDLDAALHDLKTMFKLARDVSEPPLIINRLVGIAISSIAAADVRDLILQTDCPNLYWALAALPDPQISMREALEHEAGLIEMMFPMLKDPEHTDHTAEEWARLYRETCRVAFQIEREIKDPTKLHLMATGLALRGYPMARRELLKSGMPRDEIDAMSVGQTVAVFQQQVVRHVYHEFFKWIYVPFDQGASRMAETDARLSREGYLRLGMWREAIPMAALLVPGVRQARKAEFRLEANLKGLMVLEAIRMHAAENGGQLPQTLDDITVVPVPVNPLNNRPYPFRWEGDKAVLTIENDPEIPSVWWKIHLTTR